MQGATSLPLMPEGPYAMFSTLRNLLAGLTVAAALAPALPVQAQGRPVVMLCSFDERNPGGWIPEVVLLTRQESGRVEVFDPILRALVGRPIEARVVADNRRERVYGWALAGVRNMNGQWADRMDFRLTLHKADSTATMVISVQDYDNVITGRGVCGQPPLGQDR